MRPQDLIEPLREQTARAAGSDAERRTAVWARNQLTERGWEAELTPFWCRPNWALAHAWHAGLAVAGSLLAIPSAPAGAAILLLALLSLLLDELTGASLGRWLTPERATQNLLARPPHPPQQPARITLLLTAALDAPRDGLLLRPAAKKLTEWLGGQFWLAAGVVCLLIVALLRWNGDHGLALKIVQLLPTLGLLLAALALLELGLALPLERSPNADGALAAALSLAVSLGAVPPPGLAVELVLQGAGDGQGIGLRRHLRARRNELRPASAAVVGVSPGTREPPLWWERDGSLLPLRPPAILRRLAAQAAQLEPGLHARPAPGRRVTPVTSARRRGIAALAIGATPGPETDATPAGLDAAVEFGLLLADEIAAHVGERPATPG